MKSIRKYQNLVLPCLLKKRKGSTLFKTTLEDFWWLVVKLHAISVGHTTWKDPVVSIWSLFCWFDMEKVNH